MTTKAAEPEKARRQNHTQKGQKEMERLTIDRNKNGFYIVKTSNGKPIYFAGTRQGKPQFVIWSSSVRYFRTLKTAEKNIAAMKGQ